MVTLVDQVVVGGHESAHHRLAETVADVHRILRLVAVQRVEREDTPDTRELTILGMPTPMLQRKCISLFIR